MLDKHAQLMRRATWASLAVALFLIVIKSVAYVMSGSVALLSSLVDSVLDALASILNFIAVRHALEPADHEHRFGHGKAEPLAGLGQAAFVTGSSLFIIFESLNRLLKPRPVEQGELALAVMVVSLLATLGLVLYQRHVVRATESIAIHADSIHYLSDFAQNTGVILALLLSTYLGWSIADPIIALMIAVYIVSSAYRILKQSIDQLMDRELSEEERQKICTIIDSHPGLNGYHDLRTRSSGKDIFIQVHLDMDGEMSLTTAHLIGDEVEARLCEAFPNADILIHHDPAGN